MKIEPCNICNTLPIGPFKVNLAQKGCTVKSYCIECDKDTGTKLPFMEHSVEVYGETEKQAIIRWNESMGIVSKENNE